MVVVNLFIPPCTVQQRQTLWQVGVDFNDPPTTVDSEPKGSYFLVRWRPRISSRWSKSAIVHRRSATGEDHQADDEYRPPSPVQEWR